MGLATVHGIVRQSEGRIACESEPGRGTTFTIDLPAVEPDAPEPEAAAEPATPTGHETILLVEDEEAVRAFARRVLDGLGYTVLEASAGQDALEVATRHPGPIDLLLTDVLMPQLRGPELAARLAPTRPAMKVLLMSGFDGRRPRPADPAGPAAGLPRLAKPFDARTLGRAVRDILDHSGDVAGTLPVRDRFHLPDVVGSGNSARPMDVTARRPGLSRSRSRRRVSA